MPELPEVETVKRGLASILIDKTIKNISHDTPKSFPNVSRQVEQFVYGASITVVERRGKGLIIQLSTGYTFLIHLKMTGQLVYVDSQIRFGAGHPNNSLVDSLPDRSTRVVFTFSDGSNLYFNDQRKFGWVKLLPTVVLGEDSFIKKLGPEPLEKDFTDEVFIKQIRRRSRTNVKAALLDQSVLAGVGNIYADESLWEVGLHPNQLVGDIADTKLKQLHKAVIDVLLLSISHGGSTNKNYVDAFGRKGSYMTFAKVFRRNGQPCPRCGTEIIKLRVAGRGTHICPNCQTLQKTKKLVKK
jgi:formamidopyrimidine-DNA glycosylase